MMHFSIFGAHGFIGRHLVKALINDGHHVDSYGRGTDLTKLQHLGHVIYAAGATGGSDTSQLAMLDVHAVLPAEILGKCTFESFVYLSSTRVYGLAGHSESTHEDARLSFSTDAADWFSLTKIVGESVCMNSKRYGVSIARLSNIYGQDQHPSTFLSAIRRDCLANGGTTINETAASCKDYLSISDATRYLCGLAACKASGIYNVASGSLTTHREIADNLTALGFDISFNPAGNERRFPAIDTNKITGLFGNPANNLVNDLPSLFARTLHA